MASSLQPPGSSERSAEGDRTYQVFISYSRKDAVFVHALADTLAERGQAVWIDRDRIPATAEWLGEIFSGIETARTFAFVISPASLASEMCGVELQHAVANGKRILPVLHRSPERGTVLSEELAKRQWIKFGPEDDFNVGLESLLAALDSDLEHVRAHTELLTAARAWDRDRRRRSDLLRGARLRAAEEWLARAGEHQEPAVIELQRAYLRAGRRGTRRRRRAALGSATLLVVLAAVAVLVVTQLHAKAESRRLAAAADRALERDPVAALRLAVRAADAASTSEARNALGAAIAAPYPRLVVELTPPPPPDPPGATEAYLARAAWRRAMGIVTTVDFTPDGRRLIALTGGGAGWVLDAASGRTVRRLSPGGGSGGNPSLIFTRRGDRALYDYATGVQLADWRTGHIVDIGSTASPTKVGHPEGGEIGSSGRRVILRRAGEPASEYSAASGRRIYVLRSTFASFGPRRLVIYGPTANARDASIWRRSRDNQREERLVRLRGSGLVTAAEMTTDARTALTIDDDQRLSVWNARTGRLTARLWHDVETLELNPDDTELLVTRTGGVVNLWSLETDRPIAELDPSTEAGPAEQVWSVGHFSPDGSLVATVAGAEARLWDARTGERVAELRGHSGEVHDVRFSPDGAELVTAATDGKVRVWTNATGAASVVRAAHARGVSTFGLDPTGSLLISGAENGKIKAWEGANLRPRWGTRLSAAPERVDFSSRGGWSAIDGRRATLLVSDPRGNPVRWTLPGGGSALSPNGRRIVTGDDQGVLRIFTTGSRAARRVFDAHLGAVNAVAFRRDGKIIASAGQDNAVRLWDVATGKRLDEIRFRARIGSASANSVGYSDEGDLLLIATDEHNGTALTWDPATKRRVEAPERELGTSSFAPTGTLVASATLDGGMLLWDGRTGRRITSLGDPTKPAFAFALSQDDRYLVRGGADGVLRLWSLSSRRVVNEFRGHRGAVQAVAFHPDGVHLFSAGADGTLRRYDCPVCAPADSWPEEAERRLRLSRPRGGGR